MNGIRILRNGWIQPSPGTRAIDDGRVRPLDGAIILDHTDRCAVHVTTIGKTLILEPGSRNYTDQEAIRVASMPPSERFQAEPRDLDERIERAQTRAISTCHRRVECPICGAGLRNRCVHREHNQEPVELDRPHDVRLQADGLL